MPLTFVKKYTTFLTNLEEGQALTKLEKNKELPFYEQVRDLDKLQTVKE